MGAEPAIRRRGTCPSMGGFWHRAVGDVPTRLTPARSAVGRASGRAGRRAGDDLHERDGDADPVAPALQPAASAAGRVSRPIPTRALRLRNVNTEPPRVSQGRLGCAAASTRQRALDLVEVLATMRRAIEQAPPTPGTGGFNRCPSYVTAAGITWSAAVAWTRPRRPHPMPSIRRGTSPNRLRSQRATLHVALTDC